MSKGVGLIPSSVLDSALYIALQTIPLATVCMRVGYALNQSMKYIYTVNQKKNVAV